VRLFLHQLRNEQLIFWRSREAAVFVFFFPIMLLLLLGAVYDGTYHGHPEIDYLVAGLLGYGTANTAFGGLAILLVVRREMGILKRIRSTPLPSSYYLASALVSMLLVFALQAVAIVVVAKVVYGAAWPPRPFSLVAAAAVGAAAFAAMGVGLAGLIRSQEGASAVVNVVVLPTAFLSGGFGPTSRYPKLMQDVAEVLPLKHFIDAVTGILLDSEPVTRQGWALLVVAAWGVAGLLLAMRKFTWEPREA
jgi:ABC-2 type transport system permease protein